MKDEITIYRWINKSFEEAEQVIYLETTLTNQNSV